MEIYTQIFSPIEVNTYILADKSGECAIIDCGCYNRDEFRRLEKFLDTMKLKPVLLLNTHCHLDHIFGNRMIFEKFGLKTYFHKLEEPNRKAAPEHSMFFGLKMENPPEAEAYLEHGQHIGFGPVDLIALHVPGHTSGSIAFYSEQDGFVLTGDALFAGSIGRTDLPGGNFETLLYSIRSNLLTLPPETVVYPGHGGKTTIRHEKSANPYLI
ncbi:MAG: MBL fold metallo-hydrolase [Bacteroidales bacterium]|jgi:glyoxylase-like metal-dependent hydrolase (beta-lactamase superfamily II)